MFADKLNEKWGGEALTKSPVSQLLEGARMVKIHDDVTQAAYELAERDEEKLAKVSKFVCWPDFNTWIEFKLAGIDFGVFFHGEDGKSVTKGHCLILMDDPRRGEIQSIPVAVDLLQYHMTYQDIQQLADRKANQLGIHQRTFRSFYDAINTDDPSKNDPIALAANAAPFTKFFKKILLTMLAFLNSPKLVRKRECDMSRFNARRLKRGKYPYHPHHEVTLNIDKHVLSTTEGQGDGPERCLHFVRAHLRYLVHPRYKNVSVVLVPPHMRGNPELGIMNTSYAVVRDNSKWKETVE